jgi:hypothetical protein
MIRRSSQGAPFLYAFYDKIGYRLSAIGYQLSAIGYQLSAAGRSLTAHDSTKDIERPILTPEQGESGAAGYSGQFTVMPVHD